MNGLRNFCWEQIDWVRSSGLDLSWIKGGIEASVDWDACDRFDSMELTENMINVVKAGLMSEFDDLVDSMMEN